MKQRLLITLPILLIFLSTTQAKTCCTFSGGCCDKEGYCTYESKECATSQDCKYCTFEKECGTYSECDSEETSTGLITGLTVGLFVALVLTIFLYLRFKKRQALKQQQLNHLEAQLTQNSALDCSGQAVAIDHVTKITIIKETTEIPKNVIYSGALPYGQNVATQPSHQYQGTIPTGETNQGNNQEVKPYQSQQFGQPQNEQPPTDPPAALGNKFYHQNAAFDPTLESDKAKL